MGADRRLMAAEVNADEAAFKVSPPKALFRARLQAPDLVNVRNDYVVRADGQRFLINKLAEDPAKATITVLVLTAVFHMSRPRLCPGRDRRAKVILSSST